MIFVFSTPLHMKNLRYLFIIFLLSKSLHVCAQNPLVKQWDKKFGGLRTSAMMFGSELSGFIQTSDGGFILAGHSFCDTGGDKTQRNWDTVNWSTDYWIVKVDSTGNKQWDKRFGGTGSDLFKAISQTQDGGFILAGSSDSDSSGDKTQDSRGDLDYWIVKIDSIGNKLWDKRFGGDDIELLYDVDATADGGCIIGGHSWSGATGDRSQPNWSTGSSPDIWIVKVDANGNKQWDKRFGTILDDTFMHAEQTSDGGYMIAGYPGQDNSGDFQHSFNHSAIWLIKLNAAGNMQWDRILDAYDFEIFGSMQQTSDNGYIVLAYSNSDAGYDKGLANHIPGDYDIWLVKLNSSGVKIWERIIGGAGKDGTGNSGIQGGHIMQTQDGGFLLSCESESSGYDKTETNWLQNDQPWIIKTDANGIKQWDKVVQVEHINDNGGVFGWAILDKAIACSDGSIAFANSNFGRAIGEKSDTAWASGQYDYWMIRYAVKPCNAMFTIIPDTAQLHHYFIHDFSYGAQPLNYVWDWGDGSFDTIPYPSHTYANSGTYTICLATEDSAGCQSNYCDSLQYLQGPNSTPVTVDVYPSEITAVNSVIQRSSSITIYPNPAHHILSIDSGFDMKSLEIFSLTGKKTLALNFQDHSATHPNGHHDLDISSLFPGVYFIKILTNEYIAIRKLIVQ